MSPALEAIIRSNAFDDRYGLPLIPTLNNPWAYSAYLYKLLKLHGIDLIDEVEMRRAFLNHSVKCSAGMPGLYNRWPDGTGGKTSWDELLGLGYWATECAKLILELLQKTDGIYDNEQPFTTNEARNMYRMPWLIGFLKSRAGYRVGIFIQIPWSIWMASWKYEPGAEGSFLKRWIMLEEANKHPIIGIFARRFWKNNSKYLVWALEGELKSIPVAATIAKELEVRNLDQR